MTIPIAYNLRNLAVRRMTTVMTALGVGLTVAVLLSVLALVEGLRKSFEATGDPLNVLVMRKGSTAELSSNFTRGMFQDLKFKAGIARSGKGEPMASLEMVTILNLSSGDVPNGMNITLRGLTPVGVAVRHQVRLSEGRWFETGRREVVVGKSVAKRFPNARPGGKLHFARGDWTVVGVMDGGRSAVNSEIFADLNQVSAEYNRIEVVSSCLLRATDAAAVETLIQDLETDPRLNVSAQRELDYYAAQMVSAAPIQFLGLFISVVMAVGSSFAAMNTMYAAVARRGKEIGTLRVLGFSRASILASFLVESLLLSVLGGALGCLLVLPLNRIETGIGSFVTFSEIAFSFQVTPAILGMGMGFAVLLGALGGWLPARNAARKEILAALREV